MPRPPQLSAAARTLRESIFSRLVGGLARHGADGIPLHLGDTCRPPPPAARAALQAGQGDFVYGAPRGEAPLRAALVDKLRARNGLAWVEPEQVQITAGATCALAAAARTLLDPGDEVIVPTPHWPLIRGIVSNAGAIPVEVPLSQRLYADERADAAELLEPFVGARTTALYLTSPNNPDGKVLAPRHLEQLAELARRHDLWVIADEVYEDVIFEGEHRSIAALPGMAERTISIFSLSKSYALAGYRLGYAVAAPPVLHALGKIANHTVYNVPVLLQRVATEVLGDPESAAWQAETRRIYREARDLAAARVTVPHHLPEGATYLFLDLGARAGADPWRLVERLLEVGVSVSPGAQFGTGFERHLRICFAAVEKQSLVEGLDRLARVLGEA